MADLTLAARLDTFLADGPLDQGGEKIHAFRIEPITRTGTTDTLADADSGHFLRYDNAADITVTVPTTLSAGFTISGEQVGAGAIIFVDESANPVVNVDGYNKTRGQRAQFALTVSATGYATLSGDLGA